MTVRTPHLLIIDDSPVMLRGVLRVLKSEGYALSGASSGLEGILRAKQIMPDLILLDVMLPDMSGFEVCRQIKSNPILSQCFVILISSFMISSDKQAEGLEVGADSYIARPISNRELAARIQAMFRIKAARDALQASEERFRLLYEKAPVPYQTLDENGCIISVNPAWESLTGYEKSCVTGKNFNEFVSAADLDKLHAHLLSYKSIKQPYDVELNIPRKDGLVARVMFRTFQETNNSSGTQTTFCILYDITAKSRLQNDILKTQQLEFTSTLAGGISHDFNNLLMAIMGNISLAQLYLDPEGKAYKTLEKTETVYQQAKELAHKFFILSKSGHPSKNPVNLSELIQKSVSIFHFQPEIEIISDIPDDLWEIEADSDQIQYVLTELITNGIEATPGKGKIHICVENSQISGDQCFSFSTISPGDYLHLTVQDDGAGIHPEHMGKIFDPYYTTKELGPRKGIGMGLALVNSIIHKHEGFIFIKSEVDIGTSVHVYLPAITRKH